jgi:hypothetical protein
LLPCHSLQATFKIKLDVPAELTALSNMPITDEKPNGNIKTVYFEESPIMSTYLVAFVVGVFDHIEETTADGRRVRQGFIHFFLFSCNITDLMQGLRFVYIVLLERVIKGSLL